jgi:hypothetical protein
VASNYLCDLKKGDRVAGNPMVVAEYARAKFTCLLRRAPGLAMITGIRELASAVHQSHGPQQQPALLGHQLRQSQRVLQMEPRIDSSPVIGAIKFCVNL